MFIVFKPKKILIIILILAISILSTLGAYAIVSAKNSKKVRFDYTIAIDAGHGGHDNGCSGDNSHVTEAELNLIMAKKLAKYLQDFGFKVVLTRENSDSLNSPFAENKKKDDMSKRAEIINNNNCDMVVSIHMNYYPDTTVHGAQSFYAKDNERSMNLARCVQTQLNNQLQPENLKNSQLGDYYLLNVVDIPTTIVECGFLSNPTEEMLLQDLDYQNKLTYAIFSGIVQYFSLDHEI